MIKSTRFLVFAVLLIMMALGGAHAFVVPPQARQGITVVTTRHYSEPSDREERLRSLGYSDKEISKKATSPDPAEQPKVRVDLVEDVDPLTLTAIGFGLIAFNFLVLGNLGDGGIGGLVATAINLLNQ